jgi:hypothetical protein
MKQPSTLMGAFYICKKPLLERDDQLALIRQG